LSGPARVSFLILDFGSLTLNSGQILVANGVTPLEVLIDVRGGTASASGGLNNESVVDGISMDLTPNIQLTPGAVNGEVIGGKDISFVSGGSVEVPASQGWGVIAWRHHRKSY